MMLTTTGQLYICGAGYTVPEFVSHEDIAVADSQADDSAGAPDAFSKKSSDPEDEREEEGEERSPRISSRQEAVTQANKRIVSSPRCPSDIWLEYISSRRILLVASSGYHAFVLLNDEIIGESMAKL